MQLRKYKLKLDLFSPLCTSYAHDTPQWGAIKLQVREQIFTGQLRKHGRENNNRTGSMVVLVTVSYKNKCHLLVINLHVLFNVSNIQNNIDCVDKYKFKCLYVLYRNVYSCNNKGLVQKNRVTYLKVQIGCFQEYIIYIRFVSFLFKILIEK